MATKSKLEVKLPHTRDTKGTHVFATTDNTQAVTNIYVRKGAFGDETPEEITVTITGS